MIHRLFKNANDNQVHPSYFEIMKDAKLRTHMETLGFKVKWYKRGGTSDQVKENWLWFLKFDLSFHQHNVVIRRENIRRVK